MTAPFAVLLGSCMEEDEDDGEVVVFGSEEMRKDGAIYWTDDAAERWATGLAREPLTGDDAGMIDSAAAGAASQHPVKVEDKRHARRDRP